MSSRLPFRSVVATGRGDDGTTSLLFDSARIRKDDVRTDAYGTVDEAVAALGVARAELATKHQHGALSPNFGSLADLILRIQRELFVVGAELATAPEARGRQVEGQTRVSKLMLDGLDSILRETEAAIELPREFIVPGETRVSAALELARTIVRRAERRTVTLADHDEAIRGGFVLPYLNRLADLLWILARLAEQAESRGSTTVRTSGPHRTSAKSSTQPESSPTEVS